MSDRTINKEDISMQAGNTLSGTRRTTKRTGSTVNRANANSSAGSRPSMFDKTTVKQLRTGIERAAKSYTVQAGRAQALGKALSTEAKRSSALATRVRKFESKIS